MVAIELVKPGVGDGRTPDPDLTKRIQAEALERNLIVLTAGTYVNVIRIIPPLVTTADEVRRRSRSSTRAWRRPARKRRVDSKSAPRSVRIDAGPTARRWNEAKGHRATCTRSDPSRQVRFDLGPAYGVQAASVLVRSAINGKEPGMAAT